MYIGRADGNGEPQCVLKSGSKDVFVWATSWAPDGSGLLVNKSLHGKRDILFVPVPAGGQPAEPRVLRATAEDEGSARFSRDGQLVAFVSDESGKAEVYVAAWGREGLGPPLMVSSGGGQQPRWADGRRLFYYQAPAKVMSVTVTTQPAPSVSTPAVVQDLRKLHVAAFEWDVMADGRILAIQRGEGEDDITRFDVVLGWTKDLRAQMAKALGSK